MAIPDSGSKNIVQQDAGIHKQNGNGPVKNFPVAVGDMVQDLVDRGVTEVPPRFIRPLQERTNSSSKPVQILNTKVQIPVIDMAVLLQEDGEGDPELEEKKSLLRAGIVRACEEWGFFQTINHGIPGPLLDAAMEMSQKFFALSPEEKEVYRLKKPSGVGYGRLFEDKPNAIADWIDRLTLWSQPKAVKEQDPCVITNPPDFHDVIDEYGQAAYDLVLKLMAILSQEVGQAPDFFFTKVGGGRAGLRAFMNNYPPCPQPELVMGITQHADAGTLTVLQQGGSVAALEVMSADGQWISIPPVPHALIINVGDQLQVTSNDRFKSAVHRAVATKEGRYSIANIMYPPGDGVVEPAPELCTEVPPKFMPYKFEDFFTEFVKYPLSTGVRFMERYRLSDPASMDDAST